MNFIKITFILALICYHNTDFGIICGHDENYNVKGERLTNTTYSLNELEIENETTKISIHPSGITSIILLTYANNHKTLITIHSPNELTNLHVSTLLDEIKSNKEMINSEVIQSHIAIMAPGERSILQENFLENDPTRVIRCKKISAAHRWALAQDPLHLKFSPLVQMAATNFPPIEITEQYIFYAPYPNVWCSNNKVSLEINTSTGKTDFISSCGYGYGMSKTPH